MRKRLKQEADQPRQFGEVASRKRKKIQPWVRDDNRKTSSNLRAVHLTRSPAILAGGHSPRSFSPDAAKKRGCADSPRAAVPAANPATRPTRGPGCVLVELPDFREEFPTAAQRMARRLWQSPRPVC